MKVLVLGYEYPPVGGGTAQALQRLLEAWSIEPDLEVELWTAAPPKGVVREFPRHVSAREFPCGKKRLHFWSAREQFRLLWKAYRRTLGDDPWPDVLLVWGGWPLGLLLLGAFGQIPSVVALRGSDVPGFNPRTSGPVWRKLARLVWKRADCVTANSPALRRLARKAGCRHSIEVIPNGVNLLGTDCWRGGGRDLSQLKTPRQILAVNRLVPRKQVDWILQAVGALSPDPDLSLELKVAGSGPERVRLETIACELDISDKVSFLGEVPPEEMANLYARGDLFVLASRAEGLSNALLEAMSYGLPCLSATKTGFDDIDQAVVEFDSPGKLARRIRRLLTDPDLYLERSLACLEAASHYSWEKVAERYRVLFDEVR